MQHCINLGDIQLLRLHLGEDGESIKMQVYVKKGEGGGLLTIFTRIYARKRKQTA